MTSSDPLGHHDWHSREYVDGWISSNEKRDDSRLAALQRVAGLIPHDPKSAIRALDIGAGYGLLSEQVLERFPRAEVVCHDFSEPMFAHARKRLASASERVSFARGDLSKPSWNAKVAGPFDAVVSSVAIHNVRYPERIRAIYSEIFPLVGPGGCFFNFDLVFAGGDSSRGDAEPATLENQLRWLREAGFRDVDCFWKNPPAVIIGGFCPGAS